jgi:cytochrome c
MTQEEKRVSCLERRMKFLEHRTTNGKNKQLSYDCEELLALRWAIWKLKEGSRPAVRLPIRQEDMI